MTKVGLKTARISHRQREWEGDNNKLDMSANFQKREIKSGSDADLGRSKESTNLWAPSG